MIIQKRTSVDAPDVWRDVKYCDDIDTAESLIDYFEQVDPVSKYRVIDIIWD